jgi:hypothetical protein
MRAELPRSSQQQEEEGGEGAKEEEGEAGGEEGITEMMMQETEMPMLEMPILILRMLRERGLGRLRGDGLHISRILQGMRMVEMVLVPMVRTHRKRKLKEKEKERIGQGHFLQRDVLWKDVTRRPQLEERQQAKQAHPKHHPLRVLCSGHHQGNPAIQHSRKDRCHHYTICASSCYVIMWSMWCHLTVCQRQPRRGLVQVCAVGAR